MTKTSFFPYKKRILLLFSLVFFVLLIFAYLSPLVSDDYVYSFNDASNVRPLNMYDVLQNMAMQRIYVSARVVCHFFAQWFLIFPKWAFNLVNAALNTLSLFVFYRFFQSENQKRNFFLLISGVMMIWIFLPAFGQVYLWLTGSCNYSWGIFWMLLYLLPFCLEYTSQKTLKKWMIPFSWLGALIFGAYSENAVFAALIISLLLMIHSGIHNKKLSRYLPLSFLLCCAGYCYLMSAPTITGGNKGTVSVSIFQKLFQKLSELISLVVSRFGVGLTSAAVLAGLAFVTLYFFSLRYNRLQKITLPLILLGIAGILFLFFPKEGSLWEKICSLISEPAVNLSVLFLIWLIMMALAYRFGAERRILILSWLFALGGLASLAVFVFAIYLPARSACYLCILLILSCLLLCREIMEKSGVAVSSFRKKAFLPLCALFLLCFVAGSMDIISLHQQYQDRVAIMAKAREEENSAPTLKIYHYNTKYNVQYGTGDLSETYPDWVNQYYAAYYGFDYIYAEY